MTNDEAPHLFVLRASSLIRHSSFVIRHYHSGHASNY